MVGVTENENSLCSSSVFENDTEDNGILSTSSSYTVDDTSYTDSDCLSAIYEAQVQTLVINFAILVLILIGGLARLMNKFFE